ncbi:hypothetical protein [Stenotrophomonas tuberculopleuritidis]|uniref:hypothetical protein n=1 Tax=Stenotrophomonas tuberculopleuritidis TaxID=3055079 RepID=UPI0026E5289F|nr:hypothetical protein [Stenotrophomonas sp. 704A1]
MNVYVGCAGFISVNGIDAILGANDITAVLDGYVCCADHQQSVARHLGLGSSIGECFQACSIEDKMSALGSAAECNGDAGANAEAE